MIPFFRILDGSSFEPKEYVPEVYEKNVMIQVWSYGIEDGKQFFGALHSMRLCKRSDFKGAEIYFDRE